MSKVDKIRQIYNINQGTFEKFLIADHTPTKKYLEYMVKTWKDKVNSKVTTTIDLINEIKRFDELLPYIPLKDIYHEEYKNFDFLIAMNDRAEEEKEEKTFKREDHCDVLLENDDYILIRPKTFKGSLKYGYGTKWCTASKRSEQTFKNYFNSGFLVYVIDKTKKIPELDKMAIYIDYKQNPLAGEILIYNPKDHLINEKNMINLGWSEKKCFEIITNFRYFAFSVKEKKDAIDYISSFEKNLNKLNFDELEKNIKKINENFDNGVITEVFTKLNNFKEKIKDYGY
jgi:hypothetical protein